MKQWFRIFLLGLVVVVLTACGSGDNGVDNNKTGNSPTPTSQKKDFKITLKSTEKIAGYEIHLKFTSDTPTQSNVIMKNGFLGTTGRTVNNLGADINSTTKEIKFGGFSVGNEEGVTGEFEVMRLKSNDSQGEITITKKSCIDKDANDITCDVAISLQ